MKMKIFIKKLFKQHQEKLAINDQAPPSPSFPYTIKLSLSSTEKQDYIFFRINNKIEQFRIQNWGGEREFVIEMIDSLKEDSIFFDIGASVGLISVLAAQKIKNGLVISFEPDPEIANHLYENFKLNNLSNFKIIESAIGQKEGYVEMFSNGANDYSPSLKKVNHISTKITTPINSIDNLVSNQKIPIPTFIKIDVEGAEMEVLSGMINTITGPTPPRTIFIELHPEFLPAFNTNINDIFSFLLSKKYTVTKITQRDAQIQCRFDHKTMS